MNILVCVKRVPATGGKIVLTADAQDIDTRFLGFTISPHEECGVEEAVRIVEAQGGSSTVLTLGPEVASEQLRDAMAIGIDNAVLLETDGADWDAVRDGRRDRRRDPRARGRRRRLRPDPVRQRGGRHRRLPGRDPGRDGARSAGRQRGEGHRGGRRSRRGAARGGGRRLGGLRPADAGGARREGGAEPAALPVACRAAPGAEEGDPDDRRRRDGRAGPTKDGCDCPKGPRARSRSSARARRRRRRSSSCSRSSGSWADDGPRPRRARRRAAGPAVARGAVAVAASLGEPVEAVVIGRWSTELAGGLAGSRDRHRARRRRPAPGGVRAGGLGGVPRPAGGRAVRRDRHRRRQRPRQRGHGPRRGAARPADGGERHRDPRR